MLDRRTALMLFSGSIALPGTAIAATPREVTWNDLIPPGVELNEDLNGAFIKMPGFIIPFDTSAEGVTNFMLVPYVGACIHTPPPPANQLVMVDSVKPWPGDQLWDPVWVTGTMHTQLQSTKLGQTGYAITANAMEVYEW